MYHILYVSCLLITITIVIIINIIAHGFYHCMINVVINNAVIINITVIIANSSYLRKITVVRARSEARTVENIFSWILLLQFTIVMRRRRLLSFFFFWVLGLPCLSSDIRFVKNFTPPDFQAKNFTPLISPNFNSFGDKNTKKMSRNGEIYTTGKNGSDGSDKSHLCSSCGNEFLFQYSLLVQIARSSLFVIMFCNSPESCKMQLMWAISIAAEWGAKKFCLICLYCLVI